MHKCRMITQKKLILIIATTMTLCVLLYRQHSENTTIGRGRLMSPQRRDTSEKEIKVEITQNNMYVLNNRVAQYSSYIIDQPGNYTIEVLLTLNSVYSNTSDSFIGLVKLNGIKNYKESEETIELKPIEAATLNWSYKNKKVIFQFKPDDFESCLIDSGNFNLQNIVIAVVRVVDFDRRLKIEDLKEEDVSDLIALPYSLIQFQKPSIIKEHTPLQEAVGFCAHYIYNVPKPILPWIDMHLEFNIAEILMYDSTKNFTLTTLLRQKYGDDPRLNIRKYDIERETLCRVDSKHPKHIQQLLVKLCDEFYNVAFIEKIEGRGLFNQLTANDCFMELSRKYEFVAYYDVDEFVFPRQYDTQQFFKYNLSSTCNSYTGVCSMSTFKNNRGSNQQNYYYNYIRSLIDRYGEGRDRTKLNSILFQHVPYMIPDYYEKKLISDIGNAIEMIDSKTAIFPIRLLLGDESYKERFSLVVNSKDVDYLRYFYNAYRNFIPCVYNTYLKNIPNVDKSLIRHLFFGTHYNQRWPKAIHYSKNVQGLFVHFATHVTRGSWTLHPPVADGHVLAHFRSDMHRFYSEDYEGTIRELIIDFEYVFYLLKHYTGFCEI